MVFKQQNNILSVDGKRMDETNLTGLNERVVAARNHTSEVLARLTQIESIIRNWNAKAAVVSGIRTSRDGSISDELAVGPHKLAPAISRICRDGRRSGLLSTVETTLPS